MMKTPMPEQAPELRRNNFGEVALGYTPEQAAAEASRCLNCKKRPCVAGCPVGVAIPEFITEIKNGDIAKAAAIIKETNALPAVCGRVCPQENQCERLCVRAVKGEPVAIGRLERYAADGGQITDNRGQITDNGKRIAVVGSGPAGLSCAWTLAGLGYDVTVFEAFHEPGGVLIYGIPEFRLPKEIVRREVGELKALGVSIITNAVVGQALTIDDLFDDGYDAVFIGSGAGLPSFMGIPGENLNGVFSANEFLTRVNLMKAYDARSDTPVKDLKKVVVVGGGNVAMDAARCALRLGAETVDIVYRRGMEEMPARREEIHHAREEGINFRVLTNPREILGDEKFNVRAVVCDAMELGEPDASGRRRPVVKEGAGFTLDADCVIMAIGSAPNALIRNSTPDLDFDRRGCVAAAEDGRTNRPMVYAGGDAVTGAATVILAMGAGRAAAIAIDDQLSKNK